MDHLWTPWRSTYITSSRKESGCIFCNAATSVDDESNLVVERGEHCFVILNRFPYTSGHLMIAPYAHISRLNDATQESIDEMMRLLRRAETALEQAYRSEGINLGMNLGRAAGAGIAEHIHMHMLPRWTGDANFMTSVANTRVIPESLDQTYAKLRQGFGNVKPA